MATRSQDESERAWSTMSSRRQEPELEEGSIESTRAFKRTRVGAWLSDISAGTMGRPTLRLVLIVASTAAVGALDVLTGTELTFTVFYVPIVVLSAVLMDTTFAIISAVVCAAMTILADHLLSGPLLSLATSFRTPTVPWWNGLARLTVYGFVAWAVSKLRAVIRERDAVVSELRTALAHVRTLQGLLPICAWCKSIRDDERDGEWLKLEQYVRERTPAEFTHGICPECAARMTHEIRARAASGQATPMEPDGSCPRFPTK